MIQSLQVSHLSTKEKDYVFGWAEDYADIFYLNGEKLTPTHLIQHRIPTTDDKIIVKKQYRSPHEATEIKKVTLNTFLCPWGSPRIST